MPNAVEHLQESRAYVINLDRSVQRWARVQTAILPHVGQVIRVPGIDGAKIPLKAVQHFRERALADEAIVSRQDPKRSLENWAGSMGVYLAHLDAITQGILSGIPFIVLEDDARFYRQDLAARTPAPEADGVYVWCGARKGITHAQVAKAYSQWDHKPNPWQRLQPPHHGRYTAVAYEFTSIEIAREYYDIIEQHPGSYDAAWWPAMAELPFYNLPIDIVQQEPFIKPDRQGSGTSRAPGPREYLLKDVLG